MTDCALIELEAKGFPYTWCNQRIGTDHVKEKLDRALGNLDFNEAFPQALTFHIGPVASDHHILLIKLAHSGPKAPFQFKFEASWVSHPDFCPLMRECWSPEEIPREGRVLAFVKQLNRCRRTLIPWSKSAFPNTRVLIDGLVQRIERIKEEIYTVPMRDEIEELKHQIGVLWQREETYWWQQSRTNWLKAGDLNTHYFHRKTTIRSQRNTVAKIKDQHGEWVEDEGGIENIITEFYDSLFQSSNSELEQVLSFIKPCIFDQQNLLLTAPITEAEIKEVAFKLGAFKAPGPDGLNGHFYQSSWEEVRIHLVNMVKGFFKAEEDIAALNMTNLVLNLKIEHPESVNHYRPISLCNFSYKIIAKILADRLKQVLDSCISDQQCAFIPNRLIQDNSIIVHKAFHYLKNKKSGTKYELALKMDLNKAYDRLEWNFLEGVLTRMSFDTKWITWIMKCVGSVAFRIQLSGRIVASIKPKRGLDKGIPYPRISLSSHLKLCHACYQLIVNT